MAKRKEKADLRSTLKQVSFILKNIAGKKELFYASTIALSLIVKTLNDLWLIQNGTQIEAGK